jgi:biotin-[acetyl-CoA-carboxylase] ligase BirA-like protein
MTVLGGALCLDREGQGSARCKLPVHLRRRLPAPDGAADTLEVTGQLQLVTRLDDPLEANAVDAREQRELAAVLVFGQDRDRAGLSHRLDDQDAGHDRAAREVSGEIPLVGPYALSSDDALAGLELDDLVEQQKGVAVGQNRLDLFSGQGWQLGECSALQAKHACFWLGAHDPEVRLALPEWALVSRILIGDSLSPARVEPLLRGRFGRPYLYFERIESTQRELAADAPEGAVAVAEEQTAGRGRLGRPWFAPARTSVLVSVNLRPEIATSRLPELSLVASAAVAEAIAEETGIQPEVRFPNDVLIGDRKVAGILAEARDDRVVLGIGINANIGGGELPEDVDTPATSLQIETGSPVDRATLLATLLERLEAGYDTWISGAASER